jgi:hypothetical protein
MPAASNFYRFRNPINQKAAGSDFMKTTMETLQKGVAGVSIDQEISRDRWME